jgi:ferrous iron transport protein A
MPENRKGRAEHQMNASINGECKQPLLNEPGWEQQDSALSGAVRGCRCRIRRHRARGAVRQRLLDMGFIPNAEVEVLRVATLGDPIEVKVGDSLMTLRKHEADQIEITDS